MDRLGFSESEFEEMMDLVRRKKRVQPVKEILLMDISVNDKLCLIHDQILDRNIYDSIRAKRQYKNKVKILKKEIKIDKMGFTDIEFEEMMRIMKVYSLLTPTREILSMDISVNDKLCLLDDLLIQKKIKKNEDCIKTHNKKIEHYRKNSRDWRKNNIKRINKTKLNNKFWAQHQRGLACEKCGSTKKLQFAHHNPLDKIIDVATLYQLKDRTKLKKEMSHCTLLCEHCHIDYDLYFKRNYEEFMEFMKTPKLDR